jgi:hypothetical protein
MEKFVAHCLMIENAALSLNWVELSLSRDSARNGVTRISMSASNSSGRSLVSRSHSLKGIYPEAMAMFYSLKKSLLRKLSKV